MSKRLRPVQFVIQPVVVMDDGERLTPAEVAPVTVPAHLIGSFADEFFLHLAEQEARLNDPGMGAGSTSVN